VITNQTSHSGTKSNDSVRGFLLICTTLLAAGCCLLCPKPIEDWPAEGGLVVDADTGEPLAGAYVTGRWEGHSRGQSSCFHAESTRTDSEGRFAFPAWRNTGPYNTTHYQQFTDGAYLPGYEDVGGYTYRLKMKRFTGTREERLKYLQDRLPGAWCGEAGASERNLLPYFEAIYREARELAQSDADPALNYIQFSYEWLALGYDEADRRRKERLAPIERKSRPANRAMKSVGIADLQYVVQTGLADPNAVLDNGSTMLMNAVFSGDADKVAYLLQSGADPASVSTSSGETALDMAVTDLINRSAAGNRDLIGYIDIVKLLSAAKGADITLITSLRALSSSSNPEIRALADALRRTNNKTDTATAHMAPLEIFSKSIELQPGEETHLQFTINDGRIRNIRRSKEFLPNGEFLSVRLRDGTNTGHGSVVLRTRMHGKVYMRVILEGGDHCSQPIQDYVIGTPPYDGSRSWTIEPDCKKFIITDFYLNNWPNEQPEQPSLSIDVGTWRPVDSKASDVGSGRNGSGAFDQAK
jgi:hypothetical protein